MINTRAWELLGGAHIALHGSISSRADLQQAEGDVVSMLAHPATPRHAACSLICLCVLQRANYKRCSANIHSLGMTSRADGSRCRRWLIHKRPHTAAPDRGGA